MRISDWSADVCSSDLSDTSAPRHENLESWKVDQSSGGSDQYHLTSSPLAFLMPKASAARFKVEDPSPLASARSAERRVGKECVSTCRSRWSSYHYKQT